MCLLWVLLQFAILGLYWDVPPVSSEEGSAMLEMKQEADDEEEGLLIGSDEEPLPTYRAVNSDQLEASTSSGTRPVRGASILSTCRGERAGLTSCFGTMTVISALPSF